MPRRIDQATADRVRQLCAAGNSVSAIVTACGVSRTAAYRIINGTWDTRQWVKRSRYVPLPSGPNPLALDLEPADAKRYRAKLAALRRAEPKPSPAPDPKVIIPDDPARLAELDNAWLRVGLSRR